jgi:hypothetical protein
MSNEDRRKRIVKYATLFAGAISLICYYLPPQYQVLCQALAAVCGAH